jgi:hypothetical protein
MGVLLFFAIISHPIPIDAQERGFTPTSCIENLENKALKFLDCTLYFNLDKSTRKSLNGISAGMVKNAKCKTKIFLAKNRITAALRKAQILRVSRQPVRCNIYTAGEPLSARFHMAPKIRFAGGKAVEARPGVSNVQGLPELLAELLTNWVNSSQAIESAVLKEVNKSLKKIER